MLKINSDSLPTFIIGGSAKCGTNSLRAYLIEHPDIFLSDHEICYFSKKYHRGIKWYRHQFTEGAAKTAVGEVTSQYFYNKVVAQRMHESIPNVKLVFSLRNPVSRAYSHYWMKIYKGEEYRSFHQAIFREIGKYRKAGKVIDHGYLGIGYYYRHLSRYLRFFPKENIHCVIFDNFKEDTLSEVQKICTFLGVKSDFFSSTISRVYNANVGFSIRSKFLLLCVAILKQTNARLGHLFPRAVGLTDHINEILSQFHIITNTVSGEIPKMDPDTCNYLSRLYRDDVEKLEKLLDMDLGHWK